MVVWKTPLFGLHILLFEREERGKANNMYKVLGWLQQLQLSSLFSLFKQRHSSFTLSFRRVCAIDVFHFVANDLRAEINYKND